VQRLDTDEGCSDLAASLSKRAQSTTLTSLRLESTIYGRSVETPRL
jgi:hypothetical protein